MMVIRNIFDDFGLFKLLNVKQFVILRVLEFEDLDEYGAVNLWNFGGNVVNIYPGYP